jgi:hypothetical protein
MPSVMSKAEGIQALLMIWVIKTEGIQALLMIWV